MSKYPDDPEDIGGRGDAIYEELKPKLGHVEKGMFVVIDVESGDYEIDKRDAEATSRLFKRRPSAMTWAIRVGYETAGEILSPLPLRRDEEGAMSKYTNDPDDIVGRGDAIFREQIEPHIGHVEKGMFVVIDVESGDYEIGERDAEATSRLFKRRPSAMTHAVRVGYDTAYEHVGLWPTRDDA